VHGHPDFSGGVELAVENVLVCPRRIKEMSVQAAEITVKAKLFDIGFDVVDAGNLALIPGFG
jgi:hypothetical protein